MEFRLLGDLEVVEGGKRLPLGGRKQRALLAALLLDANRVVPADALIEALWGEAASTKAPANLHSLVSRLRRTLGAERIERHAGGYLLRVLESEVDLQRFERLRAEARLLPPSAASERLRLALDLWRGPPLADFTYDSWVGSEIQRLEELRVAAIEERIDADLEAGRHKELIAQLQGLVAEHPLREGFRRQLIVALYRSGRQAEALEAYQAARRMLDEDLGLEPSPALRELEGAVLRQDPALDAPLPVRGPQSPIPGRTRRRGFLLVGASAFLAFATVASAAWWSNRGEGRRTEAAAAAPPKRPAKVEPQAARTRQKTKQTAVARRGSRPRVITPKRIQPRRSGAPVTAPLSTTRQAQPPPPPPVQVQPQPAPTPPPPPPPPPPQFRATDEFSDGDPGPLWRAVGGPAVSPVERDGELQFAFAADAHGQRAGEWFGGWYESVCRFSGPFDLRVDYQLPEWPTANGISLQLTVWFEGGVLVLARQSHTWGEQYNSWTRRNGPPGAVTTTDASGTLRIRRRNGFLYSYYRDGPAWSVLRIVPGEGPVSIMLQAGTTDDFFGDQPVRAAFDNFSISAKSKVC